MNEDERADWLARAIEDLIRGDPPMEPPPGLDRSELDALTRVARARLERGRVSAHEALRYEKQVWQEVLSRLDRLHRQDKLAANARYDSPTTNAGDVEVKLQHGRVQCSSGRREEECCPARRTQRAVADLASRHGPGPGGRVERKHAAL